MRKLSEKRAIFVKAYRETRNATKAAIAAGYSEAGAGVQGCRLLKDPKIQEEIDRQDAKLNEKLELNVEWVVRRLMMRADFDVRDFYYQDGEKKGQLKPVAELPDAAAFALQGVEVEKLFRHFAKGQAEEAGTTTKIKYADRDRALELLGRYLKMFTEKIEVTGAEGLVARLQSARKRLSA